MFRELANTRHCGVPGAFVLVTVGIWTSQTVHTPSPLKNGLVRILVYNPGREDVVLIVVTASSSLKSGERTGLITL